MNKTFILVDLTPLIDGQSGIAHDLKSIIRILQAYPETEICGLIKSANLLNDKEKINTILKLESLNIKNILWVKINRTLEKILLLLFNYSRKINTTQYKYFLTQYNTNIKASSNTTILLRIHDVISITHPYLISKPFLNKILFKKLVNNSIKSNPFLIFNSNTTKNEFNKYFEIKNDKEVVIYCVSEFKESNLNKLTEISKNINGEYISFCSSIEPKKNIKTLIEAFRMSRINNINLKLVIIGRYGWKSNWFFDELTKDKNIIWINNANDSERDILINKSKCFVFPSIIEGFGMPVIEALRLKVPVITSNIDIFKEIAGDSIFTASTFDIKGISDRINFVINPLNKNIIKDKVEFGFQISKKFTLEKVNNSWKNLLITLSKNG